MKDFVGNEIKVGSYLAKYGGGNKNCKYGMILYKVIELKDGKTRCLFLDVCYRDGKTLLKIRNSTLPKPKAVCVVKPKQEIIDIFEWYIDKNNKEKINKNYPIERIARWIHHGEYRDLKIRNK